MVKVNKIDGIVIIGMERAIGIVFVGIVLGMVQPLLLLAYGVALLLLNPVK